MRRVGTRWGALSLSLLALACAKAPSPQLDVTWAGCAQVRAGPECRLAPGQPLSLVVSGAGPAVVTTDLGPLPTSSVTPVIGGWRVDVFPPVGAHQITVRRGPSSFSLALAPHELHAVIEAGRRLRRSGDLPALRAHLASQPDLPEDARALAAGLLARALLTRGAHAEAAQALELSAAQAEAAGLTSDALRDLFAASWVLSVKMRDFERARAVLGRAEALSAQVPSERAAVLHYRAQLDLETFDLWSAQDGFRRALAWARRHGDQRRADAAQEMAAVVRVELGRPQEALVDLRALMRSDRDACARANTAINLGWALMTAGALAEADAVLQEAARLHSRSCPDATGTASAHLNRTLLALDQARWADAETHLAAAKASGGLDERMWLWGVEAEARLAEARGDRAGAREAFASLLHRAEAVDAPDARWRARVGLARAWATVSATVAIAHLELAEADLTALVRGAPASEGLSRFVARHGESARELVRLRLDRGEVDAARAVATRAMHRPLLLLRGVGRIAALEGPARQRWDRHIGRYAALRAEAVQAALDRWRVPSADTPAMAARDAARAAELRAALEAALREVPAPEAPPPVGLQAGEAAVTVFALGPERVVFVQTAQSTTARRVPLVELPQALLQIVEPRWRVDAAEPLPIPARVRVTYGLRLGPSPVTAGRRALVVGDPTGDLSGSAAEARAVAARLEAQGREVTLLIGAQATLAAVLAALAEVELFHYAGHARRAPGEGWQDSLPLADAPLSVADLLALSKTPPHVVLSGCEAGRTAPGSTHTLGLAHAFLVAGSRWVVAPVSAVPDRGMAPVMEQLHAGLAEGEPLSEVLYRLQNEGPEERRTLAAHLRVVERR